MSVWGFQQEHLVPATPTFLNCPHVTDVNCMVSAQMCPLSNPTVALLRYFYLAAENFISLLRDILITSALSQRCGHNAPGKDKDHHLGYRSLTSLRFLPSHGPSPTCPTGPASDFPQSPACVPPSGAGCGGGGSSALSWKQESLGFLGWSISGAEAGAVQLCLESSCIILLAKEGPESTLWSSRVNGQWIPTGHTHFTSFCPPNASKCFPPPRTPQVRFFCPSVKFPRGLASQFVLLAIALLCSLTGDAVPCSLAPPA